MGGARLCFGGYCWDGGRRDGTLVTDSLGQALLTLFAAATGGGLVLVGDIFARRAQWRRELRLMLREKGADWIASANEARSLLTGARLEGRKLSPEEDLKWSARARASTVFYTVPGAKALDAHVKEVQQTLNSLAAALESDDATWTRLWTACRDSVVAFTDKLSDVVENG